MAGSYNHVISTKGRLLNFQNMRDMIENAGDVYETIEEMYGMIWYLATELSDSLKLADFEDIEEPDALVEEARVNYAAGITKCSPGIQT